MKLSNVAFTGSINISGSLVLPNGTANLRPSNPQTGSLFVETSSIVIKFSLSNPFF